MSNATGFSFLNLRGITDENEANAVGGIVHLFTAAATLLVGDAVFLSGVGAVNKSATAANYVGFVGFVIAGDANARKLDDAVGVTAATVNQKVLVQISGVARAIVGATGFVAGTNFNAVPSAATAGRVIPGTTAAQRLGVVVSTQATAGSSVHVLIKQF